MKKLKGKPYKSYRVPMPPPTKSIPDKRGKLLAKQARKEAL